LVVSKNGQREFYTMGHTKTGIRVWNRTEFEKIKVGQVYHFIEPNGESSEENLIALEHRKHDKQMGIESIVYVE